MMYQPPSTARSDYFPYIVRNGAHLLVCPDGDVLGGPGSADDGPDVGDGKDAGLQPRSAGYRALRRAQGAQRARPAMRAEQPGITWGRAGPARLGGRPAEEVNERFGPDQAAREHLAGLRPDEATSPGPGSPAAPP